MGRKPNCTPAEIDRLFELRDVQKLKWREIVDITGGTEAGLCARYIYYSQKRRLEAMRAGKPVPAETRKFRGVERGEPVSSCARPVHAPAVAPQVEKRRPRYSHDADADIAARIRRQGVTAGILGDPPAGRSALDQRRSIDA